MAKYLDETGLAYFWQKVKNLFARKDAINTFATKQIIEDNRESAGYGDATFVVDSKGKTNVPGLLLKNQGDGVTGFQVNYASGGSVSFGEITGGPVHFGSVNRRFVFTENNQAYASGPAFTFERVNVPEANDSLRIDANTAVTGHQLSIYENGSLLFAIEGTTGKLTDGTNSVSVQEICEKLAEIANKLNTENPESTGVFYHKGKGTGNTDVVFRIQSNNATLNGYGDGSSVFHFAGVPVAFDTTVQFMKGFTFPTYGGDLTGNATNLKNFSVAEFRAKAINKVETGCDFNGYPGQEAQNFIVKNNNINGGHGNNWSYQAFYYDADSGSWVQNFGVKSDGTVYSNGKEMATKEYVDSAIQAAIQTALE